MVVTCIVTHVFLCVNTTALVAAAALHLAILLHKQTLDQWYHSYHVENIQLMAFVLSDVTVGLFAWYLFYALYFKIRKFFTNFFFLSHYIAL